MIISQHPRLYASAGFLPAGVVFLMVLFEYTGYSAFAVAASVLAAIALVLWAALTNTGWVSATAIAAQRGAMVMALFTALTAIRNAAITAPAIIECGRFLARQRSGLRYTALTIGGHLFALILLYGSISLLGVLTA
jgi:hypothetical protein